MADRNRPGTTLGINDDLYDESVLVAAHANPNTYVNVLAAKITCDVANTVVELLDGAGGTVLTSHKHSANGGWVQAVEGGFARTSVGNALYIKVTPAIVTGKPEH